MRFRAAALFALILCAVPRPAAADCAAIPGLYEGFLVTRVSIETPLGFPVHWIERALLGRAIDSLQSIADTLPVRVGRAFHFSDHIDSLQAVRDLYGTLRPGERVKVALAQPRFPACDLTARTVEVAYRVYTTDAAYFASRLLEVPKDQPNRKLTIGRASETKGKVQVVPFGGYNATRGLVGGIGATWLGTGRVFNSVEGHANASGTSHQLGLAVGGAHDLGRGLFAHVEWNAGAHDSDVPAGALRLREAAATAAFFAATRAKGPLETTLRFGARVEGGSDTSGAAEPGVAPYVPLRSLTTYIGATWSHSRQIWNASYALQEGKGTDHTPVDYTKHIVAAAHQVRFLPREHRAIQLDTQVNAGWIQGDPNLIPLADRFFGGNVVSNVSNNPLWRIPSGPLLRSVPENSLNATGSGQPIGGKTFAAVNVMAAFPVWQIPAVPQAVRSAKPLFDGIHLGLQPTLNASVEDFLAKTKPFDAVVTRAAGVAPDLVNARDRLTLLSQQRLSDDLIEDLKDLISTYVDPALESIRLAQQAPRTGVAWTECRKLAGSDPDTFPLAHLHDDIVMVVAPGLTAQGHPGDARDLQALAAQLDRHRRDLEALIAPIATLGVIEPSTFDAFRSDLQKLAADAARLKSGSDALKGHPNPVGMLAFTASEWAEAIVHAADPDPRDELYTLGRLAIGIGQLVPPQIASAAEAGEDLASAAGGGDAEAVAEIAQASRDLRDDLAALAPRVRALQIPPGERWARQQNAFFVRALDVAFRELNLAAVRWVVAFDAARIGPSLDGSSSLHYGIGPGIQFNIVTFQVTLGYSFNPRPRGAEGRGAFFFSIEIADLFR
jgi:hypothetical protein